MQAVVAGGVSAPGLHTSEVSTGALTTEATTAEVLGVIASMLPSGSAAIPVTFRDAVVSADVVLTKIEATAPLAIGAAFMPDNTHLYVPVPATQVSVLPAAIEAESRAAEILAI